MVTAGRVRYAYDPSQVVTTGNGQSGCSCWKNTCANGYIYSTWAPSCKVHGQNSTAAWGSANCPHGNANQGWTTSARCNSDSGHDRHGYRAPCGRTTTKTDDVYGYVTRTRTTTYTEETVPEEHARRVT